jgi:hypothetical protein
MNSNLAQRVVSVLWPAFMVAAAAEMVFFGLVDPLDLSVYGAPVGEDRMQIYSLGFLFFWVVGSAASAVADVLKKTSAQVNHTTDAAVTAIQAPTNQAVTSRHTGGHALHM